jgi:protein SCO1/2
MTRVLGILVLLVVAGQSVQAQQYSVTGMVLKVDRSRNTLIVSHQAIPGLMTAMTMPFEVRRSEDLDGLVPGGVVEFTLVIDGSTSYAERIRVVRYESVEPDPLAAKRLRLLNEIVSGSAAVTQVAVGDVVPDFTLTDQNRRQVSLADLRGKVVAINFVYTRCVLPNFCLRIANNFSVLEKRFAERLGRDLMLLTVTFDPAHDTPEVLAEYAVRFNADLANWRFLTGAVPDVARVCRLFGMDAFPDEGLMNHSLHTALIDREGRLLANIEGNQYTAGQLGDLTEAALR